MRAELRVGAGTGFGYGFGFGGAFGFGFGFFTTPIHSPRSGSHVAGAPDAFFGARPRGFGNFWTVPVFGVAFGFGFGLRVSVGSGGLAPAAPAARVGSKAIGDGSCCVIVARSQQRRTDAAVCFSRLRFGQLFGQAIQMKSQCGLGARLRRWKMQRGREPISRSLQAHRVPISQLVRPCENEPLRGRFWLVSLKR